MKISVNDYVDYINGVKNTNPFPVAGSIGVYMDKILIKAKNISPSALKLFLIIASDINNYGQTIRTRKELSKALDIKYDSKRMSILFKELENEKFIAMFGKYITVNPFLVLPRVKRPEIKSAIQDAWLDMVEFV